MKNINQRTTWRVSQSNLDYLTERAKELNLSLNGALNVVIAQHRKYEQAAAALMGMSVRAVTREAKTEELRAGKP